MSALAIIEAAKSEGLIVNLSQSGSLKVVGDQETVDRWRTRLKEHKAEIVASLIRIAKTPSWCSRQCEHYHRLEIPTLGVMQWCCSETDDRHWRRDRIDLMPGCPLKNGGESYE